MKKLLIVIFIPLLLFSCKNFMQMDIDYPDLPQGVYDLKTAFDWVTTNIDFETSENLHGDPNYFQGPYETMELRKGNCVATAILFSSFAYSLGYNNSEIAIGNGHCVSIIDNIQYSPGKVLTLNGYVPAKFEKDYSAYNFTYRKNVYEAMKRAYYVFGGK